MPSSQGLDNPYSRVVGLGLDGPVSEAAVEQAEAFYRQHGAQPAFSLCPLADPTLLEQLNRRGYSVEMFMHVWYRPLAAGETFPPPPSGVARPHHRAGGSGFVDARRVPGRPGQR